MERELVEKAKSGDRNAFGRLVLEYQNKIYHLAFSMLKNKDEALDLAQEVFVKAFRNLKNFESRSSFYTWLYRIGLNMCLNYSKREKFRTFLSFLELAEPRADFAPLPSEVLERKELNKVTEEAILALSPKQRLVFTLHFYEQKGYEEIANLLGKSVGTLKATYFKAVKKLRKSLKNYI